MAQHTKLHAAGENAVSVVRAIGRDASLCLRETSDKATCQKCMDICPGKAIRIPKSNEAKGGSKVTLSKGFCVDCGLCCAVCPTSSFIVLEPTMRYLRTLLKRANAAGGNGMHCYLTCIETGLAKEDASVVELPCLGMLTSEMWTSLMLDFPELAVYLPSDLCGRCKAKDAEMMIVDAVCAAQDIVGSELKLVEHRRELDFTDDRGKLLSASNDDDPLNLGLGDMMRDITQGADDDMSEEERGNSDMRRTRNRLRKELTCAEGEDTPGCKGAEGLTGVFTAQRAAILDAVMRFPQIAQVVKLQGMSLDTEKCTNVDDLVAACPLGAVKRDEGGAAYIDQLICVGCELCGLVAQGEGAVAPCETCMADLLLNPVEA